VSLLRVWLLICEAGLYVIPAMLISCAVPVKSCVTLDNRETGSKAVVVVVPFPRVVLHFR
jgi:hypothetical protein